MRIYRFTVTGRGSFPFDMLQQSEAWPATREEAGKIPYACPTQAPAMSITFATRKEPSGTDREGWSQEKWPISHIG